MEESFKEGLVDQLTKLGSQELLNDTNTMGMLIDFCWTMVQNRKQIDYIQTQLLDILNQEEAVQIAKYLTNWIEKRIFQMALKQTLTGSGTPVGSTGTAPTVGVAPVTETSRPKKGDLRSKIQNQKKGGDLRSLLSNKEPDSRQVNVNGRLGPSRMERNRDNRSSPYQQQGSRKKERNTNTSNERQITINAAPVNQTDRPTKKCSFYPNCTRPDCPFFHPTEPCPEGDACMNPSECLYVHSFVKPTLVPCKFKQHCTNPECPYSHPSPAALALANAAAPTMLNTSTIPCRYFPNCLNEACPFFHPAETAIVDPSTIPCKYDPYCTRFGCYYLHPSRTGAGVAAPTVIPAVSTSERAFAVEAPSIQMQID